MSENGIRCYRPNCGRIFDRIVTVGIWGLKRAVGRISENSGEAAFTVVRQHWPNVLDAHQKSAIASARRSHLLGDGPIDVADQTDGFTPPRSRW